jgi:hypothetical protein
MEQRTKTEAAQLAEQRRAEMVERLQTEAIPRDKAEKPTENADKSVATAK